MNPTADASAEFLAAAKIIGEALIKGGADAWSTMTGTELTHHMGEARMDTPVALAENWKSALVTRVAWSGDRNGALYLLLEEEGGKVIVAHMMALMMGGAPDEAATALDEEGMDAYIEAANNFIGQGSQALREALKQSVKLSVEFTRRVDMPAQAAEIFGDAPLVTQSGTFTMKGGAPHTVAVWMEAACAGVESDSTSVKESESGARGGSKKAYSRDATPFLPENMAHALKLSIPLIVVLAEKKMRM